MSYFPFPCWSSHTPTAFSRGPTFEPPSSVLALHHQAGEMDCTRMGTQSTSPVLFVGPAWTYAIRVRKFVSLRRGTVHVRREVTSMNVVPSVAPGVTVPAVAQVSPPSVEKSTRTWSSPAECASRPTSTSWMGDDASCGTESFPYSVMARFIERV